MDSQTMDEENFLTIVGPNDVVQPTWGSVPDLRPLYDDYMRQNIGTVLSMAQKISSGNMTVNNASAVFDPLALLLSTVRYQKALCSFQGIKGTLVLRTVLRSAVTCYGLAYNAWYYGPPINRAYKFREIVTSSHCQILDIPSCPEIIHKIPFIFNREFLPINATGYVTHELGYYSLDSIDPAIPPTVTYDIWAHLEDVEVTNYVEAQSLPVVVRQQEYAMPGRLPLTVAAASAGAIANVGYNVVSSALTQGFSDLKKALYVQSYQAVKDNIPTAQKSQDKFKDKTDKAQDVSSNTQTPVYPSNWGNVNSLQPTAAIQTLSEMSLSKIDPGLYGDVEYHSLADICQNAIYFGSGSFTLSNQSTSFFGSFNSLGGYCDLIGRHFRFVRYRPRIGLYFVFSPLMAARFTVEIKNVAGPPTTGNDASQALQSILVKGTSYHLIEIPWNFDSPVIPPDELAWEIELSMTSAPDSITSGFVPPVNVFLFTSAGPNTQFFSIRGPEIQDPVAPPPPAIQDPGLDPKVEQVIVEAQSSTREMNRSEPTIFFTSGPLAQINYMDDVDTIEEICSRWATLMYQQPRPGNDLLVTADTAITWGQNNLYGDNCHHFMPMFTLWRGSRDVRYVPGTDLTYGSNLITMTQEENTSTWSGKNVSNGAFIYTPEVPLQYRIPYLSRYRAVRCTAGASADIEPLPINALTYIDTAVLQRAGPDFQLFHLNRLYQGYANTGFVTP